MSYELRDLSYLRSNALIVVLVEGDDSGGAEVVLGGAAGSEHGFEAGGVGEQVDGAGGCAFDVSYFEEEAVEAVVRLSSGTPPTLSGDRGSFKTSHGFERQAEGFHFAER